MKRYKIGIVEQQLAHLGAALDDGVDEQVGQPRRGRRASHVDAQRRLVDLVLVEIRREPELTRARMIHRRVCTSHRTLHIVIVIVSNRSVESAGSAGSWCASSSNVFKGCSHKIKIN